MAHSTQQPPLRAVPMTLFPSMDNLDQAVSYCKSQLPIEDQSKLFGLLMVYHNTLLNQVKP